MIQRVNGSLAVSRALGDYEYKSVPGLEATQQLVSPEPDIYIIERNRVPEVLGDVFLRICAVCRRKTSSWCWPAMASTMYSRMMNSVRWSVHG